MNDECIGNILYQFRDPRGESAIAYFRPEMSDKIVNKASVHAARRATNQHTAMGLQLSLFVHVYASNTVLERDYENCCPHG